jgi:hypothetical protein
VANIPAAPTNVVIVEELAALTIVNPDDCFDMNAKITASGRSKMEMPRAADTQQMSVDLDLRTQVLFNEDPDFHRVKPLASEAAPCAGFRGVVRVLPGFVVSACGNSTAEYRRCKLPN